MKLRDAVAEAIKDFKRIEELSGEGELAQELAEVYQLLEPQRKKLEGAMGVWATLSRAQLIPTTDASAINKLKGKVPPILERFKNRLSKSPPDPKGGRDLTGLIKTLKALSDDAWKVARKAWTNHHDTAVTRGLGRIKLAAEGQEDLVEELEQALEQLRIGGAKPPNTDTALHEYEAQQNRVMTLVESVQVLDVPNNVKALLDAARRPQGAQFRMLTPELYEWIRAHPKIRDFLGIVRR